MNRRDDILPAAFKYQEYIRAQINRLKRTAVIAPPGSGKTRPIVEGVNDLGGFNQVVLVVCSGSAISTWVRQIPLWSRCPEYADFIRVVRGNKADRVDLWEQSASEGFGTYITNFSIFYRDYDMIRNTDWKVVIADEYHKYMRSHKLHVRARLKTYGMFKQMTRHTDIMVLASGSLVRRNAASMFTAFQLVNQFLFSSYWRFVNTYCFVDATPFGQQVHGVKNVEALRERMNEHLAYIPDSVCADALPKGRRYGIDAEITPEQKRIYNDLEKDMIAIAGDSIIITPTVLGKLMKQRQLLCCPKILDPSLGMGGGYEAILDKLDQDAHVIIFVPFRPACDYVQEDLIQHGYKNTFILRGGVDEVEQQEILQEFRETKGIIVCTIQYAESWDADSCKTSYFLGYDLTVDQNEQAEGRTRRAISEHKFVTWGYIKTNTPLDDHFLHKLGDDQTNARLILQRPEEYIRKLTQRFNDAT